MRSIQRQNQYLRLRGDTWHYVRRVPKSVRHVDERVLIYRSLETDSRKVARQRRDICADFRHLLLAEERYVGLSISSDD